MLVLLPLVVVTIIIIIVVVLVLLLVLVLVVVVVIVLATQFIFAFLCTPKNRQIGSVFTFFFHSRSKKHRKYRCFLRLGKPKTTVFTVFLCRCLAKTLVFTQFSPCCKM